MAPTLLKFVQSVVSLSVCACVCKSMSVCMQTRVLVCASGRLYRAGVYRSCAVAQRLAQCSQTFAVNLKQTYVTHTEGNSQTHADIFITHTEWCTTQDHYWQFIKQAECTCTHVVSANEGQNA